MIIIGSGAGIVGSKRIEERRIGNKNMDTVWEDEFERNSIGSWIPYRKNCKCMKENNERARIKIIKKRS